MLKLTIYSKKGKLNNQEREQFLECLRQALANGFSLNQSLATLPIIWPKHAAIFQSMHKQLKAGTKLGTLFNQIGFSKTVAAQINLALAHGNLLDCLDQLTRLERLKNEQVKKLKAELSYPLVLGGMMIILLIFMQNFLNSQFTHDHLEFGDIVFIGLACVLILILSACIRVVKLLKQQNYAAFTKLSKYPLLGKVITTYSHYIVVYELGILLASGFSLQEICNFLVSQDKASLQYELGKRVHSNLARGVSLKEIVEQEHFLPNRLSLLVTTGASKDELSKRCLLLGKSIFTDLTYQIENLVVNVQPICFLIIGLCIVGMYLKLLLPMYAMMQNI